MLEWLGLDVPCDFQRCLGIYTYIRADIKTLRIFTYPPPASSGH
jgi:hypothetical protein